MPAQTDSFGFVVPNDGPEVSTGGRTLDTNEANALIGPRHAKPDQDNTSVATASEAVAYGQEWHDWINSGPTDYSVVQQTVRVAVVLGAVAVGIGIGIGVVVCAAHRLWSSARN